MSIRRLATPTPQSDTVHRVTDVHGGIGIDSRDVVLAVTINGRRVALLFSPAMACDAADMLLASAAIVDAGPTGTQ